MKTSGMQNHTFFTTSTLGGAERYRFGFNSQEKENEIYGEGNAYSFTYRMYDARLGQFFNIDPLYFDYSYMSTYCFAANNPIMLIDKNGEGPFLKRIGDKEDKLVFQVVLYPEPGMSAKEMKDAVSRAYRSAANNDVFTVQGKVGENVRYGGRFIRGLDIKIIMLDSKEAAQAHFESRQKAGDLVQYNYLEMRNEDSNGTAHSSGNTGYINSGAFTTGIRATNILTDEMTHMGAADWGIPHYHPGEGHYTEHPDGQDATNTNWGTNTGSTPNLTEGYQRDFWAMEKGTDALRKQQGKNYLRTTPLRGFGVASDGLVNSRNQQQTQDQTNATGL